MPIKHAYVSANGDPSDTTIIGQTKWNADHDLSTVTTAEIADSTNKRYVTDAKLTVLGNTSGTNTGDQTIVLNGDVQGTGTGSFATTLVSGASLPTTDPLFNGKLWNNNGIITLSASAPSLLGSSGAAPFGATDNWVRIRPNQGTSMAIIGGAIASANIASTTTPTSGSVTNRAFRTKCASTTSAGVNSGVGTGLTAPITIGLAIEMRWNLTADATGYQFFAGAKGATSSLLAGDPSGQTQIFGVGYDAADAAGSNWQLIYAGGGAATRVDTGIPRTTGNTLLLQLKCIAGTTWYYYFADLTAGTSFGGTITSGIPTPTQIMSMQCAARNGAVAAATGHEIHAEDMAWKAG